MATAWWTQGTGAKDRIGFYRSSTPVKVISFADHKLPGAMGFRPRQPTDGEWGDEALGGLMTPGRKCRHPPAN